MSRRDPPPNDRPMLAAVTLSPETTMVGLEAPVRGGEERVGSVVVIAGAAADVGLHDRVDDECVLGRAGADLELHDARISRRHARVFREDDQWWVEDLGSTNGTSVESPTGPIRLNSRAILRDGARIFLGSTVVKFSLIDETEARYLEQISRLAATDPLTGLHATHRFDSLLDEAIRVARMTGTPLAVLMMDLDGLKAINDRHGHRFGAHTIATVGQALLVRLREVGEGCRFGGDEFCAYLPGADLDRARAFAESFRQWLEGCALELDGIPLAVTISVGLAVGAPPGSRSDLAAAADAALYRAKAAGKNRVSE
jgi:diguanylate cyclase (GGDEF)-like protein